MNNPPDSIDGARVLEWAWSDIPFGVVKDTDDKVVAVIYGLALCQYDGSNVVYRFSCNEYWETIQDMDYASVEEAKAQLPLQYRNAKAIWQKQTREE